VTLIVAVWHDGSALPVAIVLVTAAAAGQLALLNVSEQRKLLDAKRAPPSPP
jgi:hypothetical protein